MESNTQSNWNEERAKNWNLFMPPARPSEGEMVQYEEIVIRNGKANDARWALLGATPEIRSLAARCKIELLCIDKNAYVFEALKSMVKPQFSESFLCGNWLDVNVPKPVDVVFGDGSLNMLHTEKHASFVKMVYHMLHPKGLALLRVHLAEPPKFSTPHEVFEWRRIHNPQERIFSATRTHLDMLWMEPETLVIRFVYYHKKICQLYEDNLMTQDEFQAYNQLLKYNKIELFYTTRERFEDLISDYFSIEGVYCGDDYSMDSQHPIYALRRK